MGQNFSREYQYQVYMGKPICKHHMVGKMAMTTAMSSWSSSPRRVSVRNFDPRRRPIARLARPFRIMPNHFSDHMDRSRFVTGNILNSISG